MNAQEVIALLGLAPLPQEGGYYRETHRAELTLCDTALPDCYDGRRNASTAIYFLLTPESPSAWHILPSDEVFHHYVGDAVRMLRLWPDGRSEATTLGPDLAAGERPQCVVPGDVWQGCRLKEGGAWALLGCTVAPGFDFADFHVATPAEVAELAARFPEHADEVHRLAPR